APFGAADGVCVRGQQRVDHRLQQLPHQIRRRLSEGFTEQASRVDNVRSGDRDDSIREGCRRFLEGSHGDRAHVHDEADHRAVTPLCGTPLVRGKKCGEGGVFQSAVKAGCVPKCGESGGCKRTATACGTVAPGAWPRRSYPITAGGPPMPEPTSTFTAGQLPVEVYASEREMGVAAAERAAETIRAAVEARGHARVVVATGNSQFAFVEALREQDIPWDHVTAFHMDEYVGIDADHPAAFRRGIRERIDEPFSRAPAHHMDESVGIDAHPPATFPRWIRERIEEPFSPAAVHYIEGDAPDAEAEAARYEALLREAPLALVCMGIGENGHLAFNEPYE